ncbi:hypothetical protein ACJX0J_007674, partial [Zea mays]
MLEFTQFVFGLLVDASLSFSFLKLQAVQSILWALIGYGQIHQAFIFSCFKHVQHKIFTQKRNNMQLEPFVVKLLIFTHLLFHISFLHTFLFGTCVLSSCSDDPIFLGYLSEVLQRWQA